MWVAAAMGKPWNGKGGKGHRDGGLGLLHGIARRYQEQQQLTMLGPMLASAGFGQPQGAPTSFYPHPQAVPVMMGNPTLQHGPLSSVPQGPHAFCHAQLPGPSQAHCTSFPQAVPAVHQQAMAAGPAQQSNEGSSNAILSTLTSLGSTLQKLMSTFSTQEPEKPQPSPETEDAKSAMKGEPTELLHDLLRLATSRTHGQDHGEGKPCKRDASRKRAPAQEPDEAAILSIIDSVLGDEDAENTEKGGAASDVRDRLATKLSEAIKAGELALPKKKARKPTS